MTNYVLIHGAWHGGWCWSRIRGQLTAKGHGVFTPTLTGLGDRSHLLSREVGFETHIADVANLLIWEDLRDVVLVGHSYGGAIARHVADRLPDRIGSLIYLDAFVPENGKSVASYLADSGKSLHVLAVLHGQGWKVPPLPAAAMGLSGADADWVDRRCTMHPHVTNETPARLSGACDSVADIGYILTRGWDGLGGLFVQFATLAKRRGWWCEELNCSHDAMIDMPNELAKLLLQRAS
ncbi:alpha/beta hydrolase family protein [Bradyrhizobium lablabi]|uniref:alpha/beta hydrolase n=1 Tax=Bradyrhizobium lablabi TaxID=722472 RepID=UPI001BA67711|nr:alpha/beta hydrolase family protein [Bradyrhizobium lablabi]MBR0692941.1 alpha/beta hydrolase [Bradyrhizobium lablabi]